MTLYVVTGPPASGKSTWVQERAKPGAIVVDYDLLAVALTGPGAPDHGHRDPLGKVAFMARRAAIREALKYAGSHEVFIVHTFVKSTDAALYAGHGAETVVVDPGQETVMDRISRLRPPGAAEAADRWYRERELTESEDAVSISNSGKPVEGTSRRW
ncbi:AAA family ATPase [Streptomyces sp. BH105]|uniref:AAA family ATPase n=1 Tax=Streptomyces sp. BH105 TaxID=3410408 RepID=UPI003CF8C9C5